MFENTSFKTEFGKPFRYKNFGLHMCLASNSLGFKVGPSFVEYKCALPTMIQDNGFARLRPLYRIGVGNIRF